CIASLCPFDSGIKIAPVLLPSVPPCFFNNSSIVILADELCVCMLRCEACELSIFFQFINKGIYIARYTTICVKYYNITSVFINGEVVNTIFFQQRYNVLKIFKRTSTNNIFRPLPVGAVTTYEHAVLHLWSVLPYKIGRAHV